MNEDSQRLSRRRFLRDTAAVSGAAAMGMASAPSWAAESMMPMRSLGKTGAQVSILGLGGGGRGMNPQIRGTADHPDARELAEQILHRALDAGVNYIDTCAGYGESETIIGNVAATRRNDMFLATKCDKCHASGDQLRGELERSLQRLRTDTLDLWQIHNIATLADVESVFRKDGAVEVFVDAREQGVARFIGITCHSSRAVIDATLTRCRQAGISMDTLLFSFNVADTSTGGHGRKVLDAYPEIGKIAMKVFASDGAPLLHGKGVDTETSLRYALSHDFATTIIGTHTLEELEENLRIASSFQPMSPPERQTAEQQVVNQGENLWTLRA